jgi:hypothetical protein
MKRILTPIVKSTTIRPVTWVTALALLILAPASSDLASQSNREPSSATNDLRNRITLIAESSKYAKWTTVGGATARAGSRSRPVLINLVPVSDKDEKPYFIKLDSLKAGIHNRWKIRYVRDSITPVAVFAIGQYAASVVVSIAVPLNLTAIDSPTTGNHTYTLQIRYVGDTAETAFSKLEIQNARITAASL